MQPDGARFGFTEHNINTASTDGGVYMLYDGEELIYIGKAEGEDGIRGRLRSHKHGDDGKCSLLATHYSLEVHPNPRLRENMLLLEHYADGGKFPRCNLPEW